MACRKGFTLCVLILAVLMFACSDLMANDLMVLRYHDGRSQSIGLDRPSESIRQIEFTGNNRGSFSRMVLRYDGGRSQSIGLDRPSESIRQIEFTESRGSFGRNDTIRVIAATYGRNCGAPQGNATVHLARSCDGRSSCEYVIDFRVLGDPAPGCAKDYFAEWQCGRDSRMYSQAVRAEAGAGNTRILLRCPAR